MEKNAVMICYCLVIFRRGARIFAPWLGTCGTGTVEDKRLSYICRGNRDQQNGVQHEGDLPRGPVMGTRLSFSLLVAPSSHHGRTCKVRRGTGEVRPGTVSRYSKKNLGHSEVAQTPSHRGSAYMSHASLASRSRAGQAGQASLLTASSGSEVLGAEGEAS